MSDAVLITLIICATLCAIVGLAAFSPSAGQKQRPRDIPEAPRWTSGPTDKGKS
ncbi:hypothetical protein [Zhihengliuella halotolerans]|uniref:hypothetical protein n=1 Tax=Zhihengliuella halotolerans TaxID=370736 RepID=UPI0015E0D603|nr:hypothetical protein [Zhihengliuella halotolerans]